VNWLRNSCVKRSSTSSSLGTNVKRKQNESNRTWAFQQIHVGRFRDEESSMGSIIAMLEGGVG
jgi:hypothetical protein